MPILGVCDDLQGQAVLLADMPMANNIPHQQGSHADAVCGMPRQKSVRTECARVKVPEHEHTSTCRRSASALARQRAPWRRTT